MIPKSATSHIPLAEKAASFLTASPDPFHAVHNVTKRLQLAGFQSLSGASPLTGKIHPGGKYYYTVESSTLVAFAIGPKVSATTAATANLQPFGFHMIGGHTDSPNLKIKPRSKKTAAGSGCVQLGVECYGGGLWHTWFDRDLSVSGRVLVRRSGDKSNSTVPADDHDYDDGPSIQQRLVNLKDPIARISTLCIHLQSGDERKAFEVNKESHTAPIIATTKLGSEANDQARTVLEESVKTQVNGGSTNGNGYENAWKDGQEPLLLQAIAKELQVSVDDIMDFELNLYDTQPAALGGITKEFLYSARLDNLATVFCATEALCDFAGNEDPHGGFHDSADVSVMVAFDHEEVGSTSAQGAGSPVMQEAVQRIASALQGGTVAPDWYAACLRKSFILSIDQAHAIHPNYSSKHEANHAPILNGGVVIKTNSNQRYATNGITGFVVRELGRLAQIPIQEFAVRNDCPCGSTIGPIVSALTGIRTVDAGMPQLSMHSCRETMGIMDLYHGVELFKTFYSQFRSIDDRLAKDIEP